MRVLALAIVLALALVVITPGFVNAQEDAVEEKMEEKVDDGTIMKGFSADDEKKLVSLIVSIAISPFPTSLTQLIG